MLCMWLVKGALRKEQELVEDPRRGQKSISFHGQQLSKCLSRKGPLDSHQFAFLEHVIGSLGFLLRVWYIILEDRTCQIFCDYNWRYDFFI